MPDTSFCVEEDGRVYDVVTRVADDQVFGYTSGLGQRTKLVFVACSSDRPAIWISNADRPNSRVSAESILIDAAASEDTVSFKTLDKLLDENGFASSIQGYRPNGCLCDPKTLQQAFVPPALKDKLIEEDQK
ncbi:hypothetical protein [uncultured Tateyamaria sp.]|uniref:hypothetical protein n=1 Tax=uncultured Tateyamaria sp. TaxID=455651 RepID=UPI00261F725D|nr:hypothetical protein [uncultured Tateyamaria sp.]